jgi:hypothetical protein
MNTSSSRQLSASVAAGAVVNAAPREFINAGRIQFAIGNTGGDEHGVATDFAAIGQFHQTILIFNAQRRHFLRRQNLNTEALGLRHGTTRQIGTTEANRKAEIVSMRELVPACPPGASRSIITVFKPSDAP